MVISDTQRDDIARVLAALQMAQEEIDTLPLSVPSPLRDRAFVSIMEVLLEKPQSGYTCPNCFNSALAMTLSALGWEDRAAPRPQTPKERMEALIAQMNVALAFLDGLRHSGAHDCGPHE